MWKKWTKEEDEYIKNHWDDPSDVIAKNINRSFGAVRERRKMLGVPYDVWKGSRIPEVMTDSEKEMRILKMAADMRVRLLG